MIRIGVQVLIFFLSLGFCTAYGNQAKSDSLLKLIQNSEQHEQLVMWYCSLAKSLEQQNPDTAITYAYQGFELADQLNFLLGKAESTAILGDLYVVSNQLERAKEYYAESIVYFREADHLFDVTQISMILGNIHLAQNEYFEALKRYQECLDISVANGYDQLTPHLYNNMGELYLEIADYDDAGRNFQNAYNLFVQQDDEFSMAMCLSNLASIDKELGNTDEALAGFLEVIRLLSSMKSWTHIGAAYNGISEIHMALGDYEEAQEFLNLALNITENNTGNFEGPSSIYKSKIYTTAARLAFHNGDFDNSIDYARKSLSLSYENVYKQSILDNARIMSEIFEERQERDSLLKYYKIIIQYTAETQREENIKNVIQLRMETAFDELLQEKELAEIKKDAAHRQREMMYMGIMAFSILLAIILVLLYRNQKAKTDRAILRKENLELERTQLNQDLVYKNKELVTNMMYLLEKNEFITNIAKKLSEAKEDFNKTNQGVVQQLVNELKLNSSKTIWEEFEVRFKEVHVDFYDALSTRHADLTPNEIRICAFLRLNMSTKEISSITYQSVKSLNMARFRLRKKMDIDRDENLIVYLSQI